VLYWWNPTIVYCLIGIVHVDALVPPLVLGALLAIRRDRIALAVTLLGIAAGVKFWPALLVMLALATVRGDWARLARCVAVALAVHAVSVGPVLISPLQPASGLGAYASGWAINNAPFAWAVLLLGEFFGEASAQWVLRALAAVAGCAAALLVAYHSNGSLRSVLRGSLLVAAMVFYLSPAQFPWYAVWFLAPAAAMQNWPLLMASVSLPVYYLFFPLAATGRADYFQLGLAFIHVLPVLVAAVAAKLRRQ